VIILVLVNIDYTETGLRGLLLGVKAREIDIYEK
jgi:hypothetical protein